MIFPGRRVHSLKKRRLKKTPISTLFFCFVPKFVKTDATKGIYMNKETQSIISFGSLMSQSLDFGYLQVTQIEVAQKKGTTNATQRYTRTYRLPL